MDGQRLSVGIVGRFLISLCLVGLFAIPLASQGVAAQDVAGQDEGGEDEQRTEAARAKLYEALNREVSALERQSNALKLVVKLVRPTVVHIEAETTEASSVHYNRKSHVEEAGSGCIVKINGKDYVITNGHVIKAANVEKIKIRLADGRQIHPTRKWSHPETDIAVMAIDVLEWVES